MGGSCQPDVDHRLRLILWTNVAGSGVPPTTLVATCWWPPRWLVSEAQDLGLSTTSVATDTPLRTPATITTSCETNLKTLCCIQVRPHYGVCLARYGKRASLAHTTGVRKYLPSSTVAASTDVGRVPSLQRGPGSDVSTFSMLPHPTIVSPVNYATMHNCQVERKSQDTRDWQLPRVPRLRA